jgi:hypothetical protein
VRNDDELTFFGAKVCYVWQKQDDITPCQGIAHDKCCYNVPLFESHLEACMNAVTSSWVKTMAEECAAAEAGCAWCAGGMSGNNNTGFCAPVVDKAEAKASCQYRHDNMVVTLSNDKCAYRYVHKTTGPCANIAADDDKADGLRCCEEDTKFIEIEEACYLASFQIIDGGLVTRSQVQFDIECGSRANHGCMTCQ